jgi:hypothetical protein
LAVEAEVLALVVSFGLAGMDLGLTAGTTLALGAGVVLVGVGLAGAEGDEPFILTVSIYNTSIGSSYVDELIITYNLRRSRVFA